MSGHETKLKAPFPWFGGKSRVAHLVWQRFGDVGNYVEPFAGSLAVLLGRPTLPRIETVNDADRYLVNFWRAVKADPEGVAHYADWPVIEVDLRARHDWLVTFGRQRLERLDDDPEDYDPKIAGWWVWGICSWIGSGWCPGDRGANKNNATLGDAGRGVNRKLPHLGDAGRGVNRKLPHLGDAGQPGRGVNRSPGIYPRVHQWLLALSDRLRRVRVTCGDWGRVCTNSVTEHHGTTGVFLDPPYADVGYYGEDSRTVSGDVLEWCKENGGNPKLRIALCGYEGEHDLSGWEVVAWKTKGGYASSAKDHTQGKTNTKRERIWFSPACLTPQRSLFA